MIYARLTARTDFIHHTADEFKPRYWEIFPPGTLITAERFDSDDNEPDALWDISVLGTRFWRRRLSAHRFRQLSPLEFLACAADPLPESERAWSGWE